MKRSTSRKIKDAPLANSSNKPAPARTVLLAVSGYSPAIITEALWALAQETPPVIPDCVVAVTTASGARSLESQLLTPLDAWGGYTVWRALRQTILGSGYATDRRLTLESPAIITRVEPGAGVARPLEDIRDIQDNSAAAETILATVRRFSTDPEVRLLGLLSGGRKTMGALLHAALSLAGRPGDRLLHVLVSEPFDNPTLNPPFYFPGQPCSGDHRLPGLNGKIIANSSARIDLADVPLVALGELIFNRTGQAPATFASFSRLAQSTLLEASLDRCQIDVSFSSSTRTLRVNHYQAVIPEGRASVFLRQLILDANEGAHLVDRPTLQDRWGNAKITYLRPDGTISNFTDDDISNAQNTVRTELLERGQVPEPLVRRLLPLRAPIGLARDGVIVRLSDG